MKSDTVNGIENYSTHHGRSTAGPLTLHPGTLLSLLPERVPDIIDQSHQTIPQCHRMYVAGDRVAQRDAGGYSISSSIRIGQSASAVR